MQRSNLDRELSQLAVDLEVMIRQGKSVLARKALLQIDRKRIRRGLRARFANLFRRAGEPDIALGLLNRIVRSQTKGSMNPSDEEKTDYAAALIATGASLEGIQLLEEVSFDDHPDALLQLAVGHITRWDYDRAIPLLDRLIANPKSTDYQKIVAQINLGSAFIIENQIENAQRTLINLRAQLNAYPDYGLVLGNTLELLAQVATARGEFDEARELVTEASKQQVLHTGITSLLVAKTRAINNALDPVQRKAGIQELQALIVQSQKQRRWEICRDGQFVLSRILRDDASFLKVYFGTPFQGCRRRMIRLFTGAPSIPAEFIFHSENSFTSYPLIYDCLSGELEGAGKQMTFAGLPHKMLGVLSTDFFRPFRTAKLFSELYPDEYFDPHSSPDRIHSAVLRLRNELQERQIPIAVARERDGYSMRLTGATALRVYPEPPPTERMRLYFDRFRARLQQDQEFKKSQFETAMDVSPRAASRVLKWAKEQGLISSRKEKLTAVYRVKSA